MDSRTVIKIPSHCLYFCSLHSRLILCTNFLDEEGLLYPSDYIERYEIINSFSGLFCNYFLSDENLMFDMLVSNI
jgi:hypothetical protein